MTAVAAPQGRRATRRGAVEGSRPSGMGWLLAAEGAAGALGFGATVHLARRLGPSGFGRVEFAAAVAAWSLVIVRGGIEVIVYREAARRPRLVPALTDLLLGMKLAGAAVGYAAMLALAGLVGSGRGGLVAVAGLVLFPSALVADVGPRSRGRLGWLALGQLLRAVGSAGVAWALVRGPSDGPAAAGAAVLGETVVAGLFLALHRRDDRPARARFRRRAWVVLAGRGLVAGVLRFGRVGLYGADLLILGWWAGPEVGPYAAGRRLVFATVALGLVVPAAIGPALARARAAGVGPAGRVLRGWGRPTLALALAAAIGLAGTASRWMSLFFGAAYREGGPWLALVAARLPWLLAATLAQTALVACRREGQALRQVLAMTALAAVLLPVGWVRAGAWGVGSAMLVVEVAGAVLGWRSLRAMGLVRWRGDEVVAPGAAGAVLGVVCWVGGDWPLGAVLVAGAGAFGATWWGLGRFPGRVREIVCDIGARAARRGGDGFPRGARGS